MKKCVSIACVYNQTLEKGLCIGVSDDTRSYNKDVIRMCWVSEPPEQNKECKVTMQAQMTPPEAANVGVALIRSSIVGESLLRKGFLLRIPDMEVEGNEKEKDKKKNHKKS